jgi:hypothetical protein
MPSPSSLVRRLQEAHKARRKRIAALAKPDPGIQMHNGRPVAVDITPVREIYTLTPAAAPFAVTAHFSYDQFPFSLTLNGDWIISLDTILRTVCRFYGIRRAELLSARRQSPIVYRRQVAMYLARELTPLSLPQIGRRMGNRDHTTVMSGCRKIQRLVAIDPEVAREITAIKYLLGAP